MVLRFSQHIRLILCLFCVGVQSVYAHTDHKDDNKPKAGVLPTAQPLSMVNIRTSLAYNRHLVSPESDIEAANVTDEAADERLKAAGTFSELDKSGRYLDDLLDKDMLQLPVGFKKTLGTTGSVEVAVSKVEFFSQYAELTMYVRLKLPSSGASSKEKILFFGAEKVRFTRAGGISSFKAVLLGDVPIVDSPDSYTVIIKGSSGLGKSGEILDPNQTYAQVDCGQFTEAQLIAEVLIPRKTLIPLVESTLEPMEGRVTCAFKAKIVGSVDNLVGGLTFKTPFSAPGATGFGFKVQNAFFDLSNTDNPTVMAFPAAYVGDKTPAWQGVYVQNFTVYLPKQFKKKGSTARTSLSALNVIIDKTGFTGLVEANTPIFTVNEGSASGWAMSLDKIRVGLVQNSLTEGAFEGKIRLPVSKGSTLLYTGTIKKREPATGQDANSVTGIDYGLTVENADDIDFDLFKAKGKIYKGSKVVLAVINDEFKPLANLSGELSVSASLDGKYDANGIIKLDQIVFEHLILQTGDSPICVESFELKGKAGIANFPLSITSLGLKTSCNNTVNAPKIADLYIEAEVDVMGKGGGSSGATSSTTSKSPGGFSGTIGVTIRAEQNTEGDWKFKEIARPIKIAFNGDLSAFQIRGRLELYDETISGIKRKGFRGSAELVLKKMNNLTVCADAEFGSTEGVGSVPGENYYYVGGSVKNFKPIPVGGPIAINGFSGGIFYHMKPTNGSGTGGGFKTLCSTGQTYVYSANTSFGFKAGVNLTASEPLPKGTFDGYAGLEMVFARDGGLASIGIYAQAQILADIDDALLTDAAKDVVEKANKKGDFTGEPNRNKLDKESMEKTLAPTAGSTYSMFDSPMQGPLAVRIGLLMDFENKSFHGEANVYVNVGYLKGVNDGSSNPLDRNLAGRMIVHADKDLFYLHLGTSEKPMGLAIRGLPKPLNESYIQATTYLMIGGNIPSYLPPPSAQACAFFGIDQERYKNRGTNPSAVSVGDINSGKGFAFGLQFDAKVKVGGFVYAEGQLGLGLDILYTTVGNCGIATAKGRAYAFVKGEIGIAGIPLVGAGIGVFLEGGSPAPMYFHGVAKVEVTVIGTISGKLEINIGDENKCPPY